MAETDRFLFEALAQSECLPFTARDVELKSLSSGAFVSIIWRCLAKIQEAEPHLDLGIPEDFDAQGGVAARHRVGSKLAKVLKELGYAGDCGYNHFLYPNEKESRNILSWLVGKLPRADTDISAAGGSTARVAEPSGAAAEADYLSEQNLAALFSSWIQKRALHVLPNRDVPRLCGLEKLPLRTTRVHLPWVENDSTDSSTVQPLFQSTQEETSRALSVLERLAINQRTGALSIDSLDDVDDGTVMSEFGGQIGDEEAESFEEVIGSTPSSEGVDDKEVDAGAMQKLPLFFVSAAGALRENALAQLEASEEPTTMKETSTSGSSSESANEVEMLKQEAQQASFERIHGRLTEAQQRIDFLRDELDHDHDELLAVEQRVVEAKSCCANLKKELAVERQLLGLLPQAEENASRLEGLCLANEEKLRVLAKEWEAHKKPLVDEEQALLSMKSNRKARCRQFVAEMKIFRAEMKEMASTIQEKMEAMRALDKTYASLPQNINRNSYTNRIMDIIKQVHKQKHEIGKIIEDITSIQKQLNFSSQKLKRSESVTDEKLFGEATKQVSSSNSSAKDPNNPYVECYRKFSQVRELFEELISLVGDVGKKENSARDLENWITQLGGRDSSAQLERVLVDLQSVRQENSAINDQLRALRSM